MKRVGNSFARRRHMAWQSEAGVLFRIKFHLDRGVHSVATERGRSLKFDQFLGGRLQNGSPYAIGPSSVCPVLSVCLSVTFVHCGQTVGRMKLGMQVGLGPGHIVLGGPSSPSPTGAQPPIFGPYLLRPNGCMDQDATWYGAMASTQATLC